MWKKIIQEKKPLFRVISLIKRKRNAHTQFNLFKRKRRRKIQHIKPTVEEEKDKCDVKIC